MKRRPATREEIIKAYEGRRVRFETYIREVCDCRTEHGVRHIRHATAKVRVVNGVPMVRRLGEDLELFAEFFTLDGRTFVACPTVVKSFRPAMREAA
jgi:hypothetical protein